MASRNGSPTRHSPTPPRGRSFCAGRRYGASNRSPLSRPSARSWWKALTGTVVPANTLWRSGAAIDYQTDAEFVMPVAETGNIHVTAVVAAAAGNAPVGIILNLVSPIAGLASQSNVSTAIAGGADIESIASVRARLLARIQDPPRGGTVGGLRVFGRESGHPDVTRAWARPHWLAASAR